MKSLEQMRKGTFENGIPKNSCEHCGFEKNRGEWNLFTRTPIVVDGVIVCDNFATHSEVFYHYIKSFYPVVCGNKYKVMQRIRINGSGETVVSEVYG